MIIDFNRYNGGGGSGSGVTPQDVQRQIDSALTPYWESGETKDYVDEAVSGISLDGFYTSAQTDEKIASAASITYASAVSYTDAALSGFTPAGNSNILAAISSLTEYEAISGSLKTGDLIQVYDVDINGDEEGEYGLFEATVQEEEDGPGGDIIRIVYWERKDNADSVLWADKIYPWMADNDVWPVDFGEGHFLISTDDTSEDEAYNGIGFDNDGKPVITHIVPQYENGEITGMTRTDTPIGGGSSEDIELPIAAAVNELKGNIEARLSQKYYTKQEVNDIAARKTEPGLVNVQIHDYVDPAIAEVNATIENKELPISAALNELNNTTVKSTTVKNIWTGSQSDYDDIVVKDPETLYIINN